MTTVREICTYGHNTAVPRYRRIVAKIAASHCPNTDGPLQYSRGRLRQTIANTDAACRKAGM